MDDKFRGKAKTKVDGKGRVSVPAAFRRALEVNDPDRAEGEGAVVYIAHYEADPYLTCMPATLMADMTRRIEAMHPGDPRREALEEFIFENVEELRLDGSGRMVLPKYLREHAGLDGDIFFGGRGDKFRIYSADAPRPAVSSLSAEMAKLPVGASVFALLPADDAPGSGA